MSPDERYGRVWQLGRAAFESLQRGNLSAALDLIDNAIELQEIEPKAPDTLRAAIFGTKATILMQLGRLSEALAEIERCATLQDGSPELSDTERARTFYTKAQILSDLGRLSEALAEIERCATLQDGSPELSDTERARTFYTKAQILKDLGRLSEALAEIERCATLEDRSPDLSDAERARTFYTKAQILSDLGRLSEALAEIERCATLRDGSPDLSDAERARTFYTKAQILSALDRLSEALAEIERCATLRDGSPDLSDAERARTFYTKAQILNGLGRLSEALAEIQRCATLQDGSPDLSDAERALTFYTKAQILSDLGRLSEALAEIERCATLQDGSPELSDTERARTFYTKAQILKDLGRLSEALAEIERCATLQDGSPDTPIVERILAASLAARILDLLGQTEPALGLRAQALSRLRMAFVLAEIDQDRIFLSQRFEWVLNQSVDSARKGVGGSGWAYRELESCLGMSLRLSRFDQNETMQMSRLRSDRKAAMSAYQSDSSQAADLRRKGLADEQIETRVEELRSKIGRIDAAIAKEAEVTEERLHTVDLDDIPEGVLHLVWQVRDGETFLLAAKRGQVEMFDLEFGGIPIGLYPERSSEAPFELIREGWRRLLPARVHRSSWTRTDGIGECLFPPMVRELIAEASLVLLTPHGILWDLVPEELDVEGKKVLDGKRFQMVESYSSWREHRTESKHEGKPELNGVDDHLFPPNDEDSEDQRAKAFTRSLGESDAKLAFACAEVSAAAAFHPGSVVRKDDQVTPQDFFDGLRKGSRLLVLSSHAGLRPMRPLDSFLALGRRPEMACNSVVRLGEILAGEPLNVGLVILSCCETGRGLQTSQGVVSAQYVIRASGAAAVLATRWSIGDAAACMLMITFHRLLGEGQGLQDAVSATRRWGISITPDQLESVLKLALDSMTPEQRADAKVARFTGPRGLASLCELVRRDAYALIAFGDPDLVVNRPPSE